MTQIGQRLAEEAVRRGWTHEAAGEHFGVSQATYSRWCSGENIPRSTYWAKMARFLHVTRQQVEDMIVADTTGRGARGQADRLDELERKVDQLTEGGSVAPRRAPCRGVQVAGPWRQVEHENRPDHGRRLRFGGYAFQEEPVAALQKDREPGLLEDGARAGVRLFDEEQRPVLEEQVVAVLQEERERHVSWCRRAGRGGDGSCPGVGG